MVKSYRRHQKKNKRYYDDIKDQWSRFVDYYWEKYPDKKFCHVCGYTRRVELHHIIPRHIDPTKIFDEDNLIPLCRACHFRWGHLNDWDNYNPQIKYDAQLLFMIHRAREHGGG